MQLMPGEVGFPVCSGGRWLSPALAAAGAYWYCSIYILPYTPSQPLAGVKVMLRLACFSCCACSCSVSPSVAAYFCRAHTTELSKPMDTPMAPSLLWPSRGQRNGAAGAGVEKNSGSGSGQVGRGEPGHHAGSSGQGLPTLGRSLLRASHNGSADSLASPEPSARSQRPPAVLQHSNGCLKHMASERIFRLKSLRCN